MEQQRHQQGQGLTVDQVFDLAFNKPRSPRSAAYKAGCRAAIEYRLVGKAAGKRIRDPYADGSAESDAFYSGVDEGHRHGQDELDRRVFVGMQLVLTSDGAGELLQMTGAEFLDANAEILDKSARQCLIRAVASGGSWHMGGGASPWIKVAAVKP